MKSLYFFDKCLLKLDSSLTISNRTIKNQIFIKTNVFSQAIVKTLVQIAGDSKHIVIEIPML